MAVESDRELKARLREAGAQELDELVRERLQEVGVPEARQALRNPFVTSEVILLLLASPQLRSAYELRRDAAGHRRTPEAHALRLVPGLYWRDLLRLGRDSRVRPTVRRAADRHLARRLPGLAAGEKIAIARQGGPGVIALLRTDPSVRVIRALLDNPRLTEGSLMPLLTSESARPKVLEAVAKDRRWGARYPVRVALCRNPRTPAVSSVALLPSLKKTDLVKIGRDRRLAAVVRQRAELLLGGGGR